MHWFPAVGPNLPVCSFWSVVFRCLSFVWNFWSSVVRFSTNKRNRINLIYTLDEKHYHWEIKRMALWVRRETGIHTYANIHIDIKKIILLKQTQQKTIKDLIAYSLFLIFCLSFFFVSFFFLFCFSGIEKHEADQNYVIGKDMPKELDGGKKIRNYSHLYYSLQMTARCASSVVCSVTSVSRATALSFTHFVFQRFFFFPGPNLALRSRAGCGGRYASLGVYCKERFTD